jgi:hypothetical protein
MSTPAVMTKKPPAERIPGALSLGLKAQESETDRSTPSTAEVRNGRAVPPIVQGVVLN